MADTNVVNAEIVTAGITPSTGTVGMQTQVGSPNGAATVSNLANATGGIGAGNLVEQDIDDILLQLNGDETPLMTMMLKAKKVNVKSPEVQHYMIDEMRSTLTVGSSSATVADGGTFKLTLASGDQGLARECQTLMVDGVRGYNAAGTAMTNQNLMLYVVGHSSESNNPVCMCINGPAAATSDSQATSGVITLAEGTKVKVLGNSLYETQKEVDPTMIVPKPFTQYLQKRGMNQIVSDYLEAQKKRIPFTEEIIAEAAMLEFKRESNRTLWAGVKKKITRNVPKMGQQNVYFTEGLRWQFKREFEHTGDWTIKQLIALCKLFYTGEDVPKNGTLLAGKNLLESIQCIDYSKHPEITISAAVNPVGWAVTRVHTVFGDFDIKREPTLDTLGWSNSGALIDTARLVHYYYTTEHQFSDKVEGEEATREGVLVWDAVCLKGGCHVWIDGDNSSNTSDVTSIRTIAAGEGSGSNGAYQKSDFTSGTVYYFLDDVTVPTGASTSTTIKSAGTLWKATLSTTSTTNDTLTWTEVTNTFVIS